ncbi:MAG: nucleoside triphosphate pyrophosphohydrolase [Thermoleophilia bacterium]
MTEVDRPDKEVDRRHEVLRELGELYDLTAVLRRECPWDRSQRQEDIIRYTLEEVHELADALAAARDEDRREEKICGELGDLLFQVYFMAGVAEEEKLYDLGDVAAGIRRKLIRRHPHIFGEGAAQTPEDVRRTWDEVKRTTEGRTGIFHDVPDTFPSILLANKLQQRAAGVGFDWPAARDVLEKLREEIAELEVELEAELEARPASEPGEGGSAAPGEAGRPVAGDPLHEEIGDLMFSVVNLARKLGVDPELALRSSSAKFRLRVEEAARLAEEDGSTFAELDLDEQEEYFQLAKRRLAAPETEGEDGNP